MLGMGLEGVERRLLARDGVVDERETAGAGPRVGLLLPLRQLVPRLRATPPPATGVLPGRLPQKEGALLRPAPLAAVGGALGARYARLFHHLRGGGGSRGFALLRHQVVGGWRLERRNRSGGKGFFLAVWGLNRQGPCDIPLAGLRSTLSILAVHSKFEQFRLVENTRRDQAVIAKIAKTVYKSTIC
jgi:hypothetical protein